MTNSGRNVVSMSTPITLLAEHGECDVDKLRRLGIETKDIGGQYVLETSCIVDTGADISCTTNEVREALGRAPLTDANGGVTGVGGAHKGMAMTMLILDSMNQPGWKLEQIVF